MAMNSDNLADEIKSAMDALNPGGAAALCDINFIKALSTAIVNHIKNNAVVSTTDTGTVTSGAGSGGSVEATGTGTVS